MFKMKGRPPVGSVPALNPRRDKLAWSQSGIVDKSAISCSSLIQSFPCPSTAYKLFLIFNDVSWFMQPFIQCLDTKTLHLPLCLPHGSPPSPWKTCKILLKLGCRQASSPNQKFWEQSHCWKCNIGVTASLKEQSLTNTSWIWETPVRQGRSPMTHQITKT